MNKPIKRDELLEPFSHDHHHGLVFCRRIKAGIKKEISPERIMSYCRFFYERHLEIHFKEEEELLFPLLGNSNEGVAKALRDHKRIHYLIHTETDLEKAVTMLFTELTEHIRFEERILFNEIQDVGTQNQLVQINKALHNRDEMRDGEEWKDEFWQ